ncbi:MAG: tol-pal system-associated acyl-CoA thioesterase [Pseudomonadota bacterium]
MTHICNFRVYYEDTDAAGVVYYANYLKFAERARTECLREIGVIQSQMLEKGSGFVVRKCEADFLIPAKLDDLLEVHTDITEIGKARLHISQIIKRGGDILVNIKVVIACVNQSGKPVRIPDIFAK